MTRRAAARKPGMRLFKKVLPAELFESFRFYVRERARTPYMEWEARSRRLVRHNDPFAALIHETLTPLVQRHVGRPIKKSYVYLASYQEGGVLRAHTDREQCKYTLDLCIEDGGVDEPWPLYVDDREVLLQPNQGLFYLGCEQVHYRNVKPPGKIANLAFFHFVDAGFRGSLD
jgi:hypothetical protein